MVAFGALTGVASQDLGTGPTPWIGLTERINIWASMLWIAVLAFSLMRPSAVSQGSTIAAARRMPAALPAA
jgi:hypothetical protein